MTYRILLGPEVQTRYRSFRSTAVRFSKEKDVSSNIDFHFPKPCFPTPWNKCFVSSSVHFRGALRIFGCLSARGARDNPTTLSSTASTSKLCSGPSSFSMASIAGELSIFSGGRALALRLVGTGRVAPAVCPLFNLACVLVSIGGSKAALGGGSWMPLTIVGKSGGARGP